MQNIRNIAIIAHVDHGKTTLVDSIFKQSGTFRSNQDVSERVMDSNDLEKERGITILAKCASVQYQGVDNNEYLINIVDTPGHADFGGEVERILCMVDGCLLLVDSSEGVMPQTKFVLSKALQHGLCPIVVINKIDRPDARAKEVIDEVFDLFVSLDANEKQLEFPIIYASGRSGWASFEEGVQGETLKPILDTIIKHVPQPKIVDKDDKFRFLATMLERDDFLGRILTGKIYSGAVKVGMQVNVLDGENKIIEKTKITKIRKFAGITRVSVDEASAGDIVSIAGCVVGTVSNTICDPEVLECVPSTPIDPSTISITIGVNTSPLAGKEGSKLTSSMIKDRLAKEAESNVAITVKQGEDDNNFEVFGRGELQLGVLIETMRREGFELSIGRPNVVFQKDDKGQRLEPIEEVCIDLDNDYASTIIGEMQQRKGDMVDMKQGQTRTRLIFRIPTRCLIGYQSDFMTATRGTGVLNRLFHGYEPYKGSLQGHRNGVLISTENGEAVAYSIWNLQDRGLMFIKPQDAVYVGMIVGEHNRDNDLPVNVIKGKKLTNVRASGSDEMIQLTPPVIMTLERMISYIEDDELVEVTPKTLRLRKKELDPNKRKKQDKND